VSVATPVPALYVPAPRSVAPSKKCTEPAVPVGVTLAVSATSSVPPLPAAVPLGGFADSVVLVGVPAGVTVYASADEVDSVNAALSVGVNFAVNEWSPSAGVTARVASPVVALYVPAPRSVAPSK